MSTIAACSMRACTASVNFNASENHFFSLHLKFKWINRGKMCLFFLCLHPYKYVSVCVRVCWGNGMSAGLCVCLCICLLDTTVIMSQFGKPLPLDGAVLIKIPLRICLSYLLLLRWHFKLSIMPLGFQVQCCVNGKSGNYVSFTYSYPSGTA